MADDQKEEVRTEGKNCYLAVAFMILGLDTRSRYGRLIKELENNYLMGENNYPVTVTGAYGLTHAISCEESDRIAYRLPTWTTAESMAKM